MTTSAPSADRRCHGLTTQEAAARLSRDGANEIAEAQPHPIITFLGHLWAPVPWMLEAAVILQALLGEYLEASVIGGLLLFNAVLAYVQGVRAQAALAALKSRLALTATVRRDGSWVSAPARELVVGDVVRVSLGGIVPADLQLVSGNLLLDQSMLTGESLPVEAAAGSKAYAGAIVRRGVGEALVTATGARTYSGRTAELVRIAQPESSEQSAILRVVRNLAVFNGLVLVLMLAYARHRSMPIDHLLSLALTVVLASVPVALPATFTLATALGAQRLTRRGVLPTRLSAVHEAAAMDVLCSDKTGTLTENALRVTAVRPFAGFGEAEALTLAAAASGDGDPVDAAIRNAAKERRLDLPNILAFSAFDPARKRAEASFARDGTAWRAVKGAYPEVAALAPPAPDGEAAVALLAAQGCRVLAVAAGPPEQLQLVGLVALSDPPRPDAAPLLAELASLGVPTMMVTGDAAPTAETIARRIGLAGPVCGADRIPDHILRPEFAVVAHVFPEDKFRLVKALQKGGHIVGMCGDGANDAPALRQAQIGIAVSTATDVAKSAAGLVLTEPGLGGIVAAIKEGRATFQRILTYTLNALVKKIEMVLFLAVGLVVTGHAILTPLLMVVLLVTNDFLTMSLTTDRASPSREPDVWRIGAITVTAIILGAAKLAFSGAILIAGARLLGMPLGELRTLAFLTMVAGGQATVYAVRERRRLWSSRPSLWIVLSTAIDIAIALAVSLSGAITEALPVPTAAGVLCLAAAFAFLLDALKGSVYSSFGIASLPAAGRLGVGLAPLDGDRSFAPFPRDDR